MPLPLAFITQAVETAGAVVNIAKSIQGLLPGLSIFHASNDSKDIIDGIAKLQNEMLKQTNTILFAISDLREDIDFGFANIRQSIQAALEETLFEAQYGTLNDDLAAAETAIDGYVSRSRAVALGQDTWDVADLATIQDKLRDAMGKFFHAERNSGYSMAVVWPRVYRVYAVEYHLSRVISPVRWKEASDQYRSFIGHVIGEGNLPGSNADSLQKLQTQRDNYYLISWQGPLSDTLGEPDRQTYVAVLEKLAVAIVRLEDSTQAAKDFLVVINSNVIT